MSSITSFSPAAGQATGPRPIITIKADITDAARGLRWTYTLTQGSTVRTEQIVQQGAASSEYMGSKSVSFSVAPDLPDGSWSLVVKVEWYNGSVWTNITGSPSATRTFTSAAKVTVTQVGPVGWEVYNPSDPANPGKHVQNFSWIFSSTGADDYQGGYTLGIRPVGGISSFTDPVTYTSSQSAVRFLDSANKDVEYEWSIFVENRWGTTSPSTGWIKFGFGTPPTSTIVTPTDNEQRTDGNIQFSASATTTGTRRIKRVDASIWQGTTKLWEKSFIGDWASGAVVSFADPALVLPNSGSTPYQLRVVHVDTYNLPSTQAVRNFSVLSTPVVSASDPSNFSEYYDQMGYVQIKWSNAAVDTQFYAWVVERRSTALDPNTGVPTGLASPWSEVGRVYVNAAQYDYYDYTSPANCFVEYQVKQVALRNGQEVTSPESTTGPGVNTLTSSYWLVDRSITISQNGSVVTVKNGIALRLYNVTADSFTTERVSNEYNLIGRGRYVEQGDRLGVKGALTAQLRDGQGSTAREKRLLLDDFQDLNIKFLLRNPFGDLFSVFVGDIGVQRIPGTGKSEFVDVTIPYSEVS